VAEGKFDPDGGPKRPEAGRPGSVGTENCPIIVVPGVMGSRLFESSAEFSWDTIVWVGDINHLERLSGLGAKMKKDNTLYMRPPENQQTAVIREYGAQDTFREMVDGLCAAFPEREVYLFSYDWRKSCEENSEKLAVFIDWLNTEKVDLVCHSMGGLVASAYYADNIDTHKINKVITAGTHYEGSPKIVNIMVNWDVLKSHNIGIVGWIKATASDLLLGYFGLTRELKTSYDSSAQLIPTENYYSAVKMRQRVISDSVIEPIYENEISYGEYLTFSGRIYGDNSIEKAQTFQKSLHTSNGYNALLGYENAYFSVGTFQKTPAILVWNEQGDDIVDMYYDSGDGTVPYLSGSIMKKIEQLPLQRWQKFDTDHSGVVGYLNPDSRSVHEGAKQSLQWIINVLKTGGSAASSEPREADPYIVGRVACPVDVTVERDGEALSSKISDLSLITSYGRLDIMGSAGDIKMFCVDEADGYTVTLDGTDTGTMDYTLRRFDGEDNLTDERHFAGVPVTAATLIYTDTDPEATVLRVDADGDGDIDSTWTAQAHETRRAADGQQNPDPQNPDPQNPDPQNPDPQNPDPQNPDPQNPDPQNPDPQNPDPQNPDPQNPDPQNPDPQNPDPQSPDPQNPVTPPGRATSRSVGAGSPAASDRISYIGGANRILTALKIVESGKWKMENCGKPWPLRTVVFTSPMAIHWLTPWPPPRWPDRRTPRYCSAGATVLIPP
jgi:hypothetical protein